MKHTSQQEGFTLVELIVTIVVTGMFIAVIGQLSSFAVITATNANRFEAASNLAYNNLRLYANGDSASRWFTCSTTTDGRTSPNSTGQSLINTTSSVPIDNLPPPVIQTVTALAPYGCGSTGNGMPVRVVSTVTYGSPAKKVVHATYAGF